MFNNNNNNNNSNYPTYYPSKADRILSRYRPIAPKPAPAPASTTEPSSGGTCANSIDSFASSAGKCGTRPRKRRDTSGGGSSSSVSKLQKLTSSSATKPDPQFIGGTSCLSTGGGLSNTGHGGTSSSLSTQGNSVDGVVPLRDIRLPGNRSSCGGVGVGGAEYATSPYRSSSQYFGMGSGGGSSSSIVPKSDAMMEVQDGRGIIRGKSSAEVCWSDASASTGYGCIIAIPTPPPPLPLPLPDTQGFFVASDVQHTQLYHQNLFNTPLAQPPPPPPPPSSSLMQGRSTSPNGGSGSGRHSGLLSQKDVAAFMDRAAASSSTGVATSVKGNTSSTMVTSGGASAGGFTEMIRGITRLPTVADVQSLMQARSGILTSMGGVQELSSGSSSWGPKRGPAVVPAIASAASWPPQGLAEAEPDLVTLPLLPNTPSKAKSPVRSTPVYSTGGAENGTAPRSPCMPLASAATSSSSFVNPFVKTASGGSSSWSLGSIPHGTVVDRAYLDQVYGGSNDPVVLLEECHHAIWYNKAYDRALKSSSQRSSSGTSTGPYFDPLGHPTPLGSFELPVYTGKLSSNVNTSKTKQATLWGFLKKLVIQDQGPTGGITGNGTSHGGESVSSANDYGGADSTKELSLRLGEASGSAAPPPLVPETVVSNVRALGTSAAASTSLFSKENNCNWNASVPMTYVQVPRQLTTVTLERVTEVQAPCAGPEGAPAEPEPMEAVEARLGEAKEPAFISDCTSRVRWTNAAFKQMLGDGSPLPPELTFLCCSEKMPRGAPAFSGCVNLEWMKGGRRKSMTVPCDVTMLRDTSMMDMWVWKFDMAVSLCLNLSPRSC